MLNAVHFFENKTLLLSQCLKRIPEVDEQLKIKGRKAKVIEVVQIDENKYHVFVQLEVIKKTPVLTNERNRRR